MRIQRPTRPPFLVLASMLVIATVVVFLLNALNRAIWRAGNLIALGIEILLVAAILLFVYDRKPPQ